MLKKIKFLIYTKPFIFLAYYIIRIYSATFRMKIVNEEHWKGLLEHDRPVLLCTWHQQFFSAIRHFKGYARYNPGLMISRSRDGDLIAGVANRTGWHTPRGSSSRGGKQALGAMIHHLTTHGFGAHILDGPRGPMGIVKPGVIKMARETGALVVPFYTVSDKAWFFGSWDRFMLPVPFSRVTLTFGDSIDLRKMATGPDRRWGEAEPAVSTVTEPQAVFEQQRRHLEGLMRPGLHLGPVPEKT